MKRFATFAALICLIVLISAVALGAWRPELSEGVTEGLRSAWERLVDAWPYFWEGLRALFSPQ